MSDDSGGLQVRQSPRRRSAETRIADYTMLVRVPGQPAAIRAFTDAEADEAAQAAAEARGVIVSLPLSPPTGYIADSDGNLRPTIMPTASQAPS